MAEIWRPQTPDVHSYWVDAILTEASDLLNSWETTFVESIRDKLDAGMQLTQSQEEKLEQIYAKYTN